MVSGLLLSLCVGSVLSQQHVHEAVPLGERLAQHSQHDQAGEYIYVITPPPPLKRLFQSLKLL